MNKTSKYGIAFCAAALSLMMVAQQPAMAQSDSIQSNDPASLNQPSSSPDFGQGNDPINLNVPEMSYLGDPTMDLHLDSEFNVPSSLYSQFSEQLQDLNLQLYMPDLGSSNNPFEEDPDGLGLHIGALPDLTPPEGDNNSLMSGPYLNVYGGDNTGAEAGWVFPFDWP